MSMSPQRLGMTIGLCLVFAITAAAGDEVEFCGQKLPATATKVTCNDANLEGLAPLRMLSDLEELELAGTKVSDLQPLSGLRKLRKLDLAGTPTSHLMPLFMLPNLEFLNLVDTEVDNVIPLSSFTGLKEVWLSKDMLDADELMQEDLDQLREAKPDLKIELK